MDADQLCLAPFTALAEPIRTGALSPVDLTTAVLRRIDRHDGDLRGYVTVLPDAALQAARAAEAEIQSGRVRGPLHGIPIAVKDLCFTRGVATTCASPILRDFVPDEDAMVVEKLQAAGAVLLGKLNLTEFAMTWTHPTLPAPRNPWDPARWTGASSSGSGVATAAGLCFGALGTDTGGSIRFPSAACGTVGLKPTYGRVSRYGVFPLAESLDHVGPLTRSVADAAALLDALSGFDAEDPTSLRARAPECLAGLDRTIRGVKIGWDGEYGGRDVAPAIRDAITVALRVLEEAGAEVVEVAMPPLADVLEAWPRLCSAEAVAAHSDTWPTRADEYGPGFRSFLELGSRISGADYARAHMQREIFTGQLAAVFEDVDAIACPCMPAVAPPVSLMAADAPWSDAGLPFMRFTAPFDISRSPALSFPCGQSEEGLPVVMQLVGRPLEEALLCRLGHAFETATDWHQQHPSLS